MWTHYAGVRGALPYREQDTSRALSDELKREFIQVCEKNLLLRVRASGGR
jgi:hypothetical protein